MSSKKAEHGLLKERIKELECLYDIARITFDSTKAFDEVFNEVVHRIPLAWQFDQVAVCHIQIRAFSFQSAEEPEQAVFQEKLVQIGDQEIGRIRVFYPAPAYSVQDFLIEEEQLLEKLAVDIGLYVEHHEIKLREIRYLESIRQHDKLKVLAEFTAGIAHELNTPLGSVLGFSQLIIDDTKEKSTKADAEKIVQAALHAREIVKQLMYFSSELPQKIECIPLGKLIHDTIVLLKPNLDKKRIQLKVDFPEPDIVVELDAVQMTQVVFNLINNALDASPNGSEIQVYLTEKDNLVELQVRDFGEGIPTEIEAQIFDPFFTTKEIGEGMGLGLSVVLGIIKSHKGSIFVKSKVGEGTQFRIILPKNQ